jgi:hypothetical protein
MNVLLVTSLLFTVFSGSCLFFYWVAFFPCVVLKSRFAIQKVCDDIQIAEREGTISSESHGFIALARYLEIGRRAARHADLLSVAPRNKITPSEQERLEREAAAIMKDVPEVREAFSTLSRWIVALWLAARPMRLLILCPLLILAFFSDWADKKADREKKGGFVAAAGLPA